MPYILYSTFGVALLWFLFQATVSSLPPFLCPQDAKRCLLEEILQFSPWNFSHGAASTGTHEGLLLEAVHHIYNLVPLIDLYFF